MSFEEFQTEYAKVVEDPEYVWVPSRENAPRWDGRGEMGLLESLVRLPDGRWEFYSDVASDAEGWAILDGETPGCVGTLEEILEYAKLAMS